MVAKLAKWNHSPKNYEVVKACSEGLTVQVKTKNIIHPNNKWNTLPKSVSVFDFHTNLYRIARS